MIDHHSQGDDMLFEDGIVEEFRGEYRFLSNFYPSEFSYTFADEITETFKTVEHFYQAMKFRIHDYEHHNKILNASTPGNAKRLGRKELSKEHFDFFENIKIPVMRIGIQFKFKIPELRNMLLSTGDMYLQEGNHWGDEFWGVNLKTGKGKNMLGRLLMEERKRIINSR